MAGLIERVYQRKRGGVGLAIAYAAIIFAWSLTITAVIVYVAIDRYLGLPGAEVAHVMRLSLAGMAIVLLVGFGFVVASFWASYRWLSGRRDVETARAAWVQMSNLPVRIIQLTLPAGMAGAASGIWATVNASGAPWYMIVALVLGIGFTVCFAALLFSALAELIAVPVLKDIDAFLVDEPRPKPRSLSIGGRLLASVLLLIFVSAWLTSGVAARVNDPADRLLLTIVAAASVGGTFGLAHTFALSRSMIGRIKGLVDATSRVREGNLMTKVLVGGNDEVDQLGSSFNEMVSGLAERAALHSALGTYVEPSVADRLMREGEFLEGEEIDATVMFVDIFAFTSRAEQMSPTEVVTELNEFFSIIIPVIQEHGGHTNKLLGDGLMAVFGTPVPHTDHPDRALAAAYDIQRALHARYRTTMRAGVGLNTGTVVVGTTGGGAKLDFTVIGDAVNVASRVEALTRDTGDDILITQATRERLATTGHSLVPRGHTTVKGRVAPVHTYAALIRRPD